MESLFGPASARARHLFRYLYIWTDVWVRANESVAGKGKYFGVLACAVYMYRGIVSEKCRLRWVHLFRDSELLLLLNYRLYNN